MRFYLYSQAVDESGVTR
ncbi:TPA: hypothetical protein H7W12_001150 [Escherichia coli]|nr:hypothetical protein [Escherichia coli]HAL9771707.1 hypothetical protein [Escherichia coli]HAL9830347.1 hypothetical protein [Escherichia coli]